MRLIVLSRASGHVCRGNSTETQPRTKYATIIDMHKTDIHTVHTIYTILFIYCATLY